MDLVVMMHVAAAAGLLVASAVVGAWGLARARRIGAPGGAGRESRWFAQVLQLSHTLILATTLLGVVLWLDCRPVADPLHTRVYGTFMFVAVAVAYGYRTASSVANVRVFAGASLVVFALGVRAFMTGG